MSRTVGNNRSYQKICTLYNVRYHNYIFLRISHPFSCLLKQSKHPLPITGCIMMTRRQQRTSWTNNNLLFRSHDHPRCRLNSRVECTPLSIVCVMMLVLLCVLLLLPCCTHGLHTTMTTWETRCFIEDVPDRTMITCECQGVGCTR